MPNFLLLYRYPKNIDLLPARIMPTTTEALDSVGHAATISFTLSVFDFAWSEVQLNTTNPCTTPRNYEILGVIQYEIGTKTLPNNTDLNTIGLSRQRKGFDVFDIQCDSTTSNAPFLGRCILLVFGQSASNYIVQIALNVTASTNAVNIKVRGSFVISSGWGEWRTVALN